MSWLRRALRSRSKGRSSNTPETENIEHLEARCQELEQILKEADHKLRETSAVLYGLQQRYSSEHFDLQESMRNLKIERLRNAGIRAAQEIVDERYRMLRERLAYLKARLQCYEHVNSEDIDNGPMSLGPDTRQTS